MSYVPDFVELYEIVPYIEYLSLDDETIRVAVNDYVEGVETRNAICLLYTSPSPRDGLLSRMPSSA